MYIYIYIYEKKNLLYIGLEKIYEIRKLGF